MANNISVVERYLKVIDEKNKSEFKYQSLVNESAIYDSDTSKFKIPYVDLKGGIGTYNKDDSDPFASSSLTVAFQDVETDYDLGGKVGIDNFEQIDSDGIAFAGAAAEFTDKYISMRNAMTTASICKGATKKVEETITDAETFYKALRAGTNYMADHKVKPKKCELYTTEAFYASLLDMDTIKSKEILKKFDEIKIMTPDEFYTAVKINDGRDDNFDYEKESGASNINFMIVDTKAVFTKDIPLLKHIPSSTNPNAFRDELQIRFRGVSAYVLKNKKDNIYISYAPAE